MLEIEDGYADPGVLTMGDFAFPISVPYGFCEQLGGLGVFLLQAVPDVVHGSNVGLAARLGSGHTKESNEVSRVGVEVLSGKIVSTGNSRPK